MFSRLKYFKTAVIAVGVVTISCAPALYIVAKDNVGPGSDLAELQAGRKLYVSKCGGCHNLILPEKFTAVQWPAHVESMEKRSNITPDEIRLIIKYLVKGK
jgi:mono/diheme cytochrome c family protein